MLLKNQAGVFSRNSRAFRNLPAFLVFASLFTLSFKDLKNGHQPPAPGVTTELHFDEGSGTTTADASGNNHNGTLTGTTWVAGKYGNAINFNGTSSSYSSIPDHADFTLDPTQSYTWSAWVKNNNFNQWGTVWSQTVDVNNFFYFYTHSSNDPEAGPVTNGVSVYWYSGSGKLVLHSNNNVLTAGQWAYVTVTYDGSLAQNSRFTIFVNGTDVTNRTDVVSTGTLATIDPTNIRMGANQPWGDYLNASIDEVRYYRRLLSSAEIQSDMNIANTPDTESPTISITAPAAGNASGTINVTATANDNVGVVGVQFLLDGINLGSEDLTSPYSVSWNTTTVNNGSHNLTAIARDAAGNTTSSSVVTVNVNNDITAPTVNITSPVAGIINGTVSINANASDDVGVAGVQFLLNGANLGSEDLTSPYSISWTTTTITDGNYTLTARARDASGNVTTSSPLIVTVQNNPPDLIFPTVNINAPATGDVLGTINVSANASDNVGVAGVQFLLDGNNLGAEDLSAPYSVSWNTTTVSNGTHTLTAKARDAAGNTTTSAGVSVNVSNDTQPPSVNITLPSPGTISGTLDVTADASDNVAVAGVQFLLNGANLGTEDLSAPYSVSWNTTTITDGNYTLTAKARDAAGNITTSPPIAVNVLNHPPDLIFPTVNITAPAAGDVLGTINVTADASDNVGVVGVQFLLNGANLGTEDLSAPYSVSWNTTTVPNGTYTLTAKARDAAGNTTTSVDVIVTVNNPPDTQSPTISITAPPAGNVSGTINVTATANDNVGVVGVQFLLDGNNLGAEDLTSPYSVSWNTALTTNGSHVLTARARDATGNTTTSSSVIVNINNNTNLVASYGFNENSGTTLTDNSGRNNHGTLVNGPTWTSAGKYGPALVFDGNNDLVNINDDNSLDLTTGMTLEAWVNPSDLTGYKTVLCKENSTNNFIYTLSANNSTSNTTSQRPNSRMANGSANVTVTGTSKLPLNTWTHIASTYDGSVFRFYVNGVQVSTTNINGTMGISTGMLRIGGTTTLGSQYFTGIIDEVRIYNRALSQAEIQTDMNTPIAPDSEAPAVNITAPATGDVLGTINVSANASDNVGVAGVQFLLDGNNIGTEDVSAPYSVSWNTTTVTNGTHTLTAKARDAAGNTTTSAAVTVTVNNDTQPPSVNITLPSPGTISGTLDVTADASDNVAVVGVQFLLNGANLGTEDLSAPYSVSWNTTTITDGNYTLTAKARDAAGNITTSPPIAVNVLNHPPDLIFPTVNITAPAAGDVLGTINISADANDNVAVVGVQFLLNGANLGTEDLSAPYSVSWNTTTVTNGTYTLTAKARDAAGNTTTSVDLIVNVNNPPDTQSPTISITAPAAGNVSGTVNVTATANDNVGVVGVQFLLDGNNLGSEDLYRSLFRFLEYRNYEQWEPYINS